MKTLGIYLLQLLPVVAYAQACVPSPFAFRTGEELHYKVIYNWGMLWLESAQASFTVKQGTLNGRTVFAFTGSGSTLPKYDWFFKVRDNFKAWADTSSLKPLRFEAEVHEGGKKEKHIYLFNHRAGRAYTVINRSSKRTDVDTVPTGPCTIDVLTAIYYARSIDYSKCKVNDTVGISLLLDGKVYPTYVRYRGRDIYKSAETGEWRCIKFSPLLIEGTIFKKGEDMTVWVSDDENKLPVYIETPITVGTVKVRLTSYKGLRYPEDARKSAGAQ